MEATEMTIYFKDGRPPFKCPYSETNLYRYQKTLGDQIKEIDYFGGESPLKVKPPVKNDPKLPQQEPSVNNEMIEKLIAQNTEILEMLKKIDEKLLTKRKAPLKQVS